MSTTYTRRTVLQMLGLGAGAASLAACAPSGGGSTSRSSGDASADGGNTTTEFSFGSWTLNEEAGKPVIQGLLDSYGKANGVTVKGVSYPFNEYLNQLTLQARGGQFKGAAQLDIAWLGALASLGTLKDLGPLADGRGYTEAALASGQHGGAQLGLPWTTGAIGLVSNSDILDRAGVSASPKTIDDFEAALVKIKALGDGMIPYAAATKVAQLKDILTWMETFGSPLLDGDTVTIGDDPSVEAVTWYKSLYDQGLIAPDVDRFDARALFGQGRAAIYDDAIVGKAAVTKDSPVPDLAAKLDPLARPVLKAGDDPRSLLWGHVVVVIDGEGSDTAADFAQWITSDPETTIGYFEDLSLPPTTQEALKSDVVQGDAYTTTFTERITATATPSPFWRFPQYAQMESAVAEQVQAVLVGGTSPADAMAAAGRAVQGLIK